MDKSQLYVSTSIIGGTVKLVVRMGVWMGDTFYLKYVMTVHLQICKSETWIIQVINELWLTWGKYMLTRWYTYNRHIPLAIAFPYITHCSSSINYKLLYKSTENGLVDKIHKSYVYPHLKWQHWNILSNNWKDSTHSWNVIYVCMVTYFHLHYGDLLSPTVTYLHLQYSGLLSPTV